MATKGRYSTSGSSLRKSLGPPSREFNPPMEEQRPAVKRKSKIPVGLTAGSAAKPQSSGTLGGQPQRRATMGRGGSATSRLSTQKGKRQTLALGGSSRPSAGRTSLYGAVGGSTLKKDPRPLSDKSYQSASIKKLIAFLSERNYPKTLTHKSLQSPTCKEFLHIFNFLMENLDETLVIDGMNIVEDVPHTLKLLGYPFTVSKNHLLLVGSPSSWPLLLGALTWLVDCCSVPDNTDKILFSHGDDFDSDTDKKKVEFEVEELMYHTYMTYGEESQEYQDLVERRTQAVREEVQSYQAEIERLHQENVQMSAAIEDLSKSSLPSLQAQLQKAQEEHAEVVQYLKNDLLPSISQTETAINEIGAATSEIEMQIEASKQRAQQLEEQIRVQPMSAKDAHELHQKIADAEDSLEKNSVMQQEGIQRVSELQMQHNKNVSIIDKECRHVNEKLHRLAAVLPDAASLSPLYYDTSDRANPEILEKLVSQAKTLRQEAITLQQRVATSCSELESKIISGETTLSSLHSEQVKRQLEIENLQHTLDIEKTSLNQKKKKIEDAMKSQQAEKHALEKQLIDLRQKLQCESDAEKELKEFKKYADSRRRQMARELREKDNHLKEYIMALTKFVAALQHHQEYVRENVKELVDQFNQVKLTAVPPRLLEPLTKNS